MTVVGVIVAIIAFLLLVTVHEGGHFLAAKICGVKVNEFSIGMGPLIFDKQVGETQYSFRAIPIGGYCKLEGEDESSDDLKSYNHASWWKKFTILIAGVFNNILLAIIIFFFLFLYVGTTSQTIASVNDNGPAASAGIMPGDIILSVDDQQCDEWLDVVNYISNSTGEISIKYSRDGAEHVVNALPIFNEEVNRKILGFSCAMVHSPSYAINTSLTICKEYFTSIRDFIVGLVSGQKSDDVEFVGVVGVVSMVSEEVQYGFINVLYIIALISLSLGSLNLLPIPGLDGGRLLFLLIRGITNGKLSTDTENLINAIGIIIVIILMIFLVFKDTINLFV